VGTVGQKNDVIDGGSDPPTGRANLWGNGRHNVAYRKNVAVDIGRMWQWRLRKTFTYILKKLVQSYNHYVVGYMIQSW